MSRTRVAAPQFTNAHEAAETAQQPKVDLNPGTKGQEQVDLAPAHSPADIDLHAFMEQRLEVQVHEKPGLDIPGQLLNVNGEDCVIPFGRPVKIKRKFVQQLLDMRETTFTQPKRNPFQVEHGNALIPKTTLLYPFSVINDPHPHGYEWLRREQMRQTSIAAGLR